MKDTKQQKKNQREKHHFTFTISKKLMGGFISVLLLLACIIVISIYQLSTVNSEYETLIKERVTKLSYVKDLKDDISMLANNNRGFLLTGETRYIDDYDATLKSFNDTIHTLDKSITSGQAQKHLNEMKTEIIQYDKYSREIRFLKSTGKEKEYIHLMTTDIRRVGTDLKTNADELAKYQQNNLDLGIQNATEKINTTKLSLIIIGIITIIAGISIAILISRLIANPIIRLSNTMNKVASGDLSIEPIQVKNKDEIGTLVKSFNKMTTDLRAVITHITESSSQVAASSQQLTASSEQSTSAAGQVAQIAQETATATNQQLSKFQEVTASIQEMASGMDQISSNSETMLESTENAAELTEKGTTSVENVVEQMNQIYHSVEHTAEFINKLGERSKDISGIVSLITNIADQTNLLALNAAIEAARAGEHGKGFAVVADEVRKLAEESKKSADQITDMITLIQKDTEQAVASMEAGNKQVETGLSHTHHAQAAFTEITTAINSVTEKVQEVSASVEEMNALSGQIANAIEHVEVIAQQGYQNSQESSAASEEMLATMEEVSSSAQSLSNLAEDLQGVVATFKI